jgi:hypothetical protein
MTHWAEGHPEVKSSTGNAAVNEFPSELRGEGLVGVWSFDRWGFV